MGAECSCVDGRFVYKGGDEEWTEHKDPKGRTYWYNQKTKQSSWDDPNASPTKYAPPPPAAPDGGSPQRDDKQRLEALERAQELARQDSQRQLEDERRKNQEARDALEKEQNKLRELQRQQQQEADALAREKVEADRKKWEAEAAAVRLQQEQIKSSYSPKAGPTPSESLLKSVQLSPVKKAAPQKATVDCQTFDESLLDPLECRFCFELKADHADSVIQKWVEAKAAKEEEEKRREREKAERRAREEAEDEARRVRAEQEAAAAAKKAEEEAAAAAAEELAAANAAAALAEAKAATEAKEKALREAKEAKEREASAAAQAALNAGARAQKKPEKGRLGKKPRPNDEAKPSAMALKMDWNKMPENVDSVSNYREKKAQTDGSTWGAAAFATLGAQSRKAGKAPMRSKKKPNLASIGISEISVTELFAGKNAAMDPYVKVFLMDQDYVVVKDYITESQKDTADPIFTEAFSFVAENSVDSWKGAKLTLQVWNSAAGSKDFFGEVVLECGKDVAAPLDEDMIFDLVSRNGKDDEPSGQIFFHLKYVEPNQKERKLMSKEDKRKMKREEARTTLLFGEEAYFNDLTLMKEEFYDPLVKGFAMEEGDDYDLQLSKKEIKTLFSNFNDIYEMHQNIYELLAVTTDANEVRGIWKECGPVGKKYHTYINTADKSLQWLGSREEDWNLHQFLEDKSKVARLESRSLGEFIMLPIAYITTYQPIAQALLNWAEPDDQDAKRVLNPILKDFKSITRHIQSKERQLRARVLSKQIDEVNKVQDVSNRLQGVDTLNLVDQKRRLVRESGPGEFKLLIGSTQVKLFLFNDLLLWAEEASMEYKGYVFISAADIKPMPPGKVGFKAITQKSNAGKGLGQFICTGANAQDDLQQWVALMLECKDDAVQPVDFIQTGNVPTAVSARGPNPGGRFGTLSANTNMGRALGGGAGANAASPKAGSQPSWRDTFRIGSFANAANPSANKAMPMAPSNDDIDDSQLANKLGDAPEAAGEEEDQFSSLPSFKGKGKKQKKSGWSTMMGPLDPSKGTGWSTLMGPVPGVDPATSVDPRELQVKRQKAKRRKEKEAQEQAKIQAEIDAANSGDILAASEFDLDDPMWADLMGELGTGKEDKKKKKKKKKDKKKAEEEKPAPKMKSNGWSTMMAGGVIAGPSAGAPSLPAIPAKNLSLAEQKRRAEERKKREEEELAQILDEIAQAEQAFMEGGTYFVDPALLELEQLRAEENAQLAAEEEDVVMDLPDMKRPGKSPKKKVNPKQATVRRSGWSTLMGPMTPAGMVATTPQELEKIKKKTEDRRKKEEAEIARLNAEIERAAQASGTDGGDALEGDDALWAELMNEMGAPKANVDEAADEVGDSIGFLPPSQRKGKKSKKQKAASSGWSTLMGPLPAANAPVSLEELEAKRRKAELRKKKEQEEAKAMADAIAQANTAPAANDAGIWGDIMGGEPGGGLGLADDNMWADLLNDPLLSK